MVGSPIDSPPSLQLSSLLFQSIKNDHNSQDENGTGLLHKAVYYNHRDIADWLMDKYPESMSVRDNVSRKSCSLSPG